MRRPTRDQLLLWAVLLAGALPRAFLALTDDGLYWPDEIYQTLEPAHRLVFHHGMIAQEFVQGSRSWVLPALIAVPLWMWKLAGGTEPHSYLVLIKLCFVAISVATAASVYKLARACAAGALAATAGAALFSLMTPAIYFGFRALSETASALPVVLGFALALDPASSRRRRALGASLLGFSVLLRLQNGIFCLGLLAALLLPRPEAGESGSAGREPWSANRRRALDALLVLAAWAAIDGALDLATWGSPFHSAVAYLRFNLVEGRSALWGTAAFSYYAQVLWRCTPLPLLCLALLSPFAARRAPGLLLAATGFALLHSLVPHKELRFIVPVLPLFCALAALGLEEISTLLRARRLRTALAFAVIGCAGVDALHFHTLQFWQLGQYESVKPRAWAYQDFAGVNRLLLAAHDRPDLCGLKFEGVDLVWSGGYSYLHREVPLYQHDRPPTRASGKFNYVIAVAGTVPGEVIAQERPWQLLRIGASCRPDPDYSPLLR